ncbi:MAG: ISL3 family transposase, partial [Longicatena sp.]
VESISITHKSDGLYACIKLQRKEHICPACDFKTSTVKGYSKKKILHSLTTHTPCFILYNARRMKCDACGKTFYEDNPFAYKNMKISFLTVFNVLNDLKKPTETFTSVGNRYRISDTTAAAIFDSHVFIPRRKLPKYINVDEVYAFSSDRSNYVCVFVDFLTGKTIDLLPTRRKEDLIKYFRLIPLEERKEVELVSMDMWETYRIVAKYVFPNARTVVDKFHLYQELHRRITTIRIAAMNRTKPKKLDKEKKQDVAEKHAQEQATRNYYVLKKFNWLLFKNEDHKTLIKLNDGSEKLMKILDPNVEKKYNKALSSYCNYYDIYDMMLTIDPELEIAMNLKYKFDQFYKTATYENSKEQLEDLIIEFSSCGINELVNFANTLKRWKKEIINSFIIIDKDSKRKMNNGIIENRNKIIKQIKHNSNGYRNWSRFRTRALYVLNDDTTFRIEPIITKK